MPTVGAEAPREEGVLEELLPSFGVDAGVCTVPDLNDIDGVGCSVRV
jgi:hypothetical protein